MKLQRSIALIVVMLACGRAPGHAQAESTLAPNLSGVWTLNRQQSNDPQHVGFGPDGPTLEGRGSRGGGFGPSPSGVPDDEEGPLDKKKTVSGTMGELTNEAQHPSPMLTIKQADSDVTIIDFQGRIRTFHATGKKQTQQLSTGSVESTTRWDGPRLVIEYALGGGRKVIYTYVLAEPKRLLVLVKFEGRGAVPIVTEVYDSALEQ